MYKALKKYYYFKKYAEKEPIFILGNQKSGTSAIVHLLGNATSLPYTCDLNTKIKSDIIAVKYLNLHISQKHYKSFDKKIIKEPNLTFRYDDLKKIYPRSKFVFIIREPVSNIKSILSKLKFDEADFDINKLRKAHNSIHWERILFPANLGIHGSDPLSNLAERWNKAANVYLENKQDFYLVKYEDFLADKVGVIKNIIDDLGLEYKFDIENKKDEQFQPKGISKSNNEFFDPEQIELITNITEANYNKIY